MTKNKENRRITGTGTNDNYNEKQNGSSSASKASSAVSKVGRVRANISKDGNGKYTFEELKKIEVASTETDDSFFSCSSTNEKKKSSSSTQDLVWDASAVAEKRRMSFGSIDIGRASAMIFPGGNEEHTFEELKEIEKNRRRVLGRSDMPFHRVLLCWVGTVLRLLALDPLLWATLVIYIIIRAIVRIGLPDYIEAMTGGDITVIGSFLSFFLVFFVVNSQQRFDDQYGHCMAAKGCVLDVASLARATLPRDRGLRMVRYLNASYIAGFVGLSDTYTFANFFAQHNKTMKLLTEAEFSRIDQCNMNAGGSCYRELVAWCQFEIQEALEEGEIDHRLGIMYREKILAFQGAISALYNFKDQPVPFFYLHFISMLSALYLPLFAISTAFHVGNGSHWTGDIVSALIVFLQAVFVIGLRELGQRLADPFGEDIEDLSVMFYVNFTYEQSNRIMAAKYPRRVVDGNKGPTEEEIVRERSSIGGAWDSAREDAAEWSC